MCVGGGEQTLYTLRCLAWEERQVWEARCLLKQEGMGQVTLTTLVNYEQVFLPGAVLAPYLHYFISATRGRSFNILKRGNRVRSWKQGTAS